MQTIPIWITVTLNIGRHLNNTEVNKSQGLFTVDSKFPKSLAGKYMEHDSLGLSSGKFSGATEHLKS